VIGLGNSVFKRNFTPLSDAGNLGNFLILSDGCRFGTSQGGRLITDVDVDHIVTDTNDTLITSDGNRLITFEE
jgi:hypothetical protein